MLNDPKASRFVDIFLANGIDLRKIAATSPDRKLYPEYMPWLQDAMLMEAHAYFTELRSDLSITHLVQSDFAYLNEPLAELYGIPDVHGWDLQRVALPAGSPRGGFLTMAAVLKTTANGTTTSPVKRGAFVWTSYSALRQRRRRPTPAASSRIPAAAPRRSASNSPNTTQRHLRRRHVKMDGYGFALESFDVVGRMARSLSRDGRRLTG